MGGSGLVILRPRLWNTVARMNSGATPYDPLDPHQRLQRGRERTAFFRQTDMFPLAAMTMVAFVPIAVWQKSLAIPFLGWMLFVPFALGLLVREIGERFGIERLAMARGLLTVPLAIVLYVTLALVHPLFPWWFAAVLALCLAGRFLQNWVRDMRRSR